MYIINSYKYEVKDVDFAKIKEVNPPPARPFMGGSGSKEYPRRAVTGSISVTGRQG
jgi:hypothetical protein